MNNEVVKRETNAVGAAMSDWGAPVISSQDVIIPKILLMQGLSVAVTEGKAQMGEFRDSVTNNLLGAIDKPFEAIPFYVDKVWDIMKEQADGSFKWDRTVPVVEGPQQTGYNDDWQWESAENGIKIKNVRRFNFYLLLPKEIADGAAMPYIFSFKSTSIKEGKKLFTQMYIRNVRAQLPPAAFHINISGTREKNQKGIFCVPKYMTSTLTTPDELQECLAWIKTIKSGRVKVDDSDIQKEAQTVAADTTGEF